MNLNEIAESDLSFTLEDATSGFGVSLIFKNNSDEEVTIVCQTTDIGYFVDPESGQGIISRTVDISGRISTFTSNNVTVVKGSIVKYYDTNGIEYKTAVVQVLPDRKLGVLKMFLEARD